MAEVRLFNDSKTYRNWIGRGPEGYVLNMASGADFVLHKAECAHISSLRPTANWAPKAYASKAADLEHWARVDRGGSVSRCRTCAP